MRHDAETVRRYARLYDARAQEVRAERRRRAAEVLARLPELAGMLRRDFGARRVGYFGSLRTGSLHEASDVDLYVDRIARGRYFDAVHRLSSGLGVPVDLVELEDAPSSLREAIEREGVALDG